MPRGLAEELKVPLDQLNRVSDPLFPGFDLRFWKKSHPVQVVSEKLEFLLVNLSIAFDASGALRSVVLGEKFFFQVRIHFEPDVVDGSWIEQHRTLD